MTIQPVTPTAAASSSPSTISPFTFIGLDLSLTGTGIAVISPDAVTTYTVGSKGHDGDTYPVRQQRLATMKSRVLQHVPDSESVILAMEGPSFGSTGGSAHERAGFWWLIYSALAERGQQVTVIVPSSLKRYATGAGGASKDTVLAAVVRRYLDVDVRNNNESDALVLAAMLARHHGYPLEASLPKAQLSGMEKVRWAS